MGHERARTVRPDTVITKRFCRTLITKRLCYCINYRGKLTELISVPFKVIKSALEGAKDVLH